MDSAAHTPVGLVYSMDGKLAMSPLPGFEHMFRAPVSQLDVQLISPLSPPETPIEERQHGSNNDSNWRPECLRPVSSAAAVTPLTMRVSPGPNKSPWPTIQRPSSAATTVLKKDASSPGPSNTPLSNKNKKLSTPTKERADTPFGTRKESNEPQTTERTFHFNDTDALRLFFRTRLRELGLGAQRQLVTLWIRRIAPKRLSVYGPYHKHSSKGVEPQAAFVSRPPWWPEECAYIEPAHLPGQELTELAISILLYSAHTPELNSTSSSSEPPESWAQKLDQGVKYYLALTPDTIYSPANALEYRAAMKERALDLVLPEILDVAKKYEEFVQGDQGREGDGMNVAEATYTWKGLPGIKRKVLEPGSLQRKRGRDTSDRGDEDEDVGNDAEQEQSNGYQENNDENRLQADLLAGGVPCHGRSQAQMANNPCMSIDFLVG